VAQRVEMETLQSTYILMHYLVLRPAGSLGNGWTMGNGDGHLHILHDGTQQLVLYNETNANRLWTKEHGYYDTTFVKNGDNAVIKSCRFDDPNRPANLSWRHDGLAMFNTANRGAWEVLTLEKDDAVVHSMGPPVPSPPSKYAMSAYVRHLHNAYVGVSPWL
jgi:hypothetical protein